MNKIKLVLPTILMLLVFVSSPSVLMGTTTVDSGVNDSKFIMKNKITMPIEEEAIRTTNTQNIRIVVSTTTDVISSRISEIIAPNYTPATNTSKVGLINSDYWFKPPMGLSAGDDTAKYGVWSNLSLTLSENDKKETESDATLGMGIIGADYQISPKILAGVALSYENNDQDTTFNLGHIDQDGISLIPYFGFLFNDMISFDVMGSYSWLNIDQDRLNGIENQSFDSKRWFISANVNGYYSINETTNLTAFAEYTFRNEDHEQKIFNKNETTELGTITVGTEIGRLINANFEAYANLAYSYDTTYEKMDILSYDRDAFTLGTGARLTVINNLSFDFNLTTELGREDQDQLTGMLNIRYAF
ncbi:MAG: autotransporter outer membrane beta-barrel domain-containing protein [Desulfamplus sp.]|nr:autotransporter outer membrane beta-barrel domain-containing protein [Desulfamplus sp.]